MGALPTGTVTFLFTDIEGSTNLLQTLGPRYRELLERHAGIVRDAVGGHGGVEVSTEGDSFFAVFASAVDALTAAVAIQRRLAEQRWPEGVEVRLRMGLHTGEGQVGGDNYVGLDVNRAARIAAAGHGGQVLLSAASRALVEAALPEDVTLRDLGAHRLKDLDRPEHLAQAVIGGLGQDFPPLRSLEIPNNLPAELSSFVGRQREVDEAATLLAGTRLLTLTGPGGTGKTRLAIRVAGQVASGFADGVFFVDLAPLTDPALVGPTVARSLRLTEQAGRAVVERLKAHLEPMQLLLVLDNFEHLLPASRLVEELLAAAPRLKVVVTSRSILNLYGEQEFAVPPLALPDLSAMADIYRLSQYEAVALFLQRARAAKPAFALTNENAPAVAEICTRLDGLPLAVELAASRIRVLEPREILARLVQHLPLLTTSASNVPIRQRTLHGTIEWSYELLPPAEQRLFGRLGIFVAGWTLDAAEAICNPDRELGLDTFEGVVSLVEQSLAQRRAEAGESRFGMLETIREFARDQLQRDGAIAEIARRHLDHYRDLAELAEPHFVSSGDIGWTHRLEREHDNVRAALRHALDAGYPADGLHLAAALWRFWLQHGYLREGRSWLEALLALEPDGVSAARAKASIALGGLTYWLSDADATEEAYEAAERLYREIGDRGGEAEALYNLAFVPVMRKDPPGSRKLFEKSLALAEEIGRPDLVAQTQVSLGTTLLVIGDSRTALRLFEQALSYFRPTGNSFHIGWAIGSIAQANWRLGNYDAARTAYAEAITVFTEANNLPGIGAALEGVAAFEAAAGRHREAVRLIGAGAALRETTGASAPMALSLLGDAETAAREAIGDEEFELALVEGRRMTLKEASDYAVSLASDEVS
jgi:predicted ATPase/class 3 adenylate cyclase